VAEAIPGMFIAVIIFLVAWLCTQLSGEIFKQVAAGQLRLGMLDAHTAPATRHIVNASLWLFALAMAYPYLPGAQTEAFKGLSVILGIMVSIGASGLVGQVASGVILVYTRALSLGEYVRIQECEGTVTEIGLFVTRLRNGMGTEYALPNALVIGNVTRNFSRATRDGGHAFEAGITIGYDTPWRQVHALLLEAAASVPAISREPAPCVVQAALQDFYVAYRLVVHMQAGDPQARARVPSELHAAIQDVFNRHGVQIMSPSYYEDPAQPKVVPPSRWFTPPASPDGDVKAPREPAP
jgi:small-conductance mechanosensitive channel